MWVSAPSLRETSVPELIEITGMPACTAAVIAGPSTRGSGIETTSPSGLRATASSINARMRFGS